MLWMQLEQSKYNDKEGNIKNPKAMLLKAIKKKWHPEIFKTRRK